MSNYSKTTDFEAKDSLPTGDSGKIIRGAEFETEFDAISTAIATKADTAGPTFTGTLTFETLSDGTIGVTAFVDEDNMASDSATLVPTQQSVKAYVDSQVTAQDLDFQADSGGALSIDLDSEALTLTGGTGIDTSGALNEVTFAIDSTVATLTGTQTLTNKTLTAPTISGNLTTDGNIDGRDVATDGAKLDGIEAGATADQTAAEIRTLVDSATDSNVFTDADHTKLDGIEANATADQTAAEIRTLVDSATDSNVFTDADHTKLDGIEASATADQTDAEIRAAVEAATDSNVFTDADHTKLDGIEASADVTDTANVTAAGALMDSEVTNLAQVKAFDSADYATAAQGSTADSALQNVVEDTTPQLGGDLASNGNDILFADNDKAIFGAGSDLQIYHDGSASYIDDQGTGNLKIKSNGVATQILDGSSLNLAVFNAGNGQAQLYNVNSGTSTIRLATTSTGIDVTGSISADGLTVNTTNGSSVLEGTGISSVGLQFKTNASNRYLIQTPSASADLAFLAGGTTKSLSLGSNGDISFYEDTGTTAKFLWSASDEKLTIDGNASAVTSLATTVSESVLELNGNSTSGSDALYFGAINSGGRNYIQVANGSGTTSYDLLLNPYGGNVGIGTSSPDARLHLKDSTGSATTLLQLETGWNNPSGNKSIEWTDATSALGRISVDYSAPKAKMRFGSLYNSGYQTDDVMTLTADGNVGIGTSSPFEKLSVGGADETSLTNQIAIRASDNDDIFRIRTNNSTEQVSIEASGDAGNGFITFGSGSGSAERMRISSDGSCRWTPDGTTQDMTLDASGNLLVGKTAANFTVAGHEIKTGGFAGFTRDGGAPVVVNRLTDDGALTEFYRGASGVGSIGTFGGNLQISPNTSFGVDAPSDIFLDSAGVTTFKTNGTENARIDASGNLLVGTTSSSPTTKVNITQTANNLAAYVFASASSGYNATVFAVQGNQNSSNESYILADFVNGNASGRTVIYDSGDIDNTNGAYGSLSDVKLKTDITDAGSQWEDIKAIRFRKYKMIADPEQRVQMGVIAQELEEAGMSGLVRETNDKDMQGNDLGTTTKSVKYSILYTKAVKALQEAMDRIETLEARITTLESN